MNDWTIMIYMAGDNNLSDDMITSINEIRTASSQAREGFYGLTYKSNLSIIVDYDTAFPTADSKRYIFSKAGEVETPKKETSNTCEAIKNLIKTGITEHKADKYALIISGHSDAFQGQTLLVDENPPGITTLRELQRDISAVLSDNNLKKLDILCFEGCVMNTLEVMYEFKDLADVWIGSQGSIPNYAWDYRNITKDLINSPKPLENDEFVRIIIENTKNFHSKYSFGGRSVDISACDLNKLESFVRDLGQIMLLMNYALFLPILDIIDKGNEDISKNRFDFMEHPIIRMLLSAHWKSQTFMRNQAVDLFDFVDIFGKVCSNYAQETQSVVKRPEDLSCLAQILNLFFKVVGDRCRDLVDNARMNKLVLKGMSTGLDFHYANGISIFFPWTILAFLMTQENYAGSASLKKDGLAFTKTPAGKLWLNFLVHFIILTERPAGDLSDIKAKWLEILSPILATNVTVPSSEIVFTKTQLADEDDFDLEQISCELLNHLKTEGIKFEDILLNDETLNGDLSVLDYFRAELFDSEGGGTRDDHTTTRGSDRRALYFERYRNLRVKKSADPKISRDF